VSRSGRACWAVAVLWGLPAVCAAAPDDRVRAGVAVGPAVEVAMPGNREGERGAIVAPSVGLRLASWFEYVVEGHVLWSTGPVGGVMAGVQPVGWRIHAPGRTQPFVSMAAGVVYSGFDGLYGLDRRRNYVTHVGGGIRRLTRGGGAWWVEARVSHLSNLGTAGRNMGLEYVAILVGAGR
jgi:hypothetical protein